VRGVGMHYQRDFLAMRLSALIDALLLFPVPAFASFKDCPTPAARAQASNSERLMAHKSSNPRGGKT
jgi:hypothetical protein